MFLERIITINWVGWGWLWFNSDDSFRCCFFFFPWAPSTIYCLYLFIVTFCVWLIKVCWHSRKKQRISFISWGLLSSILHCFSGMNINFMHRLITFYWFFSLHYLGVRVVLENPNRNNDKWNSSNNQGLDHCNAIIL